jgi:hypothetical protein
MNHSNKRFARQETERIFDAIPVGAPRELGAHRGGKTSERGQKKSSTDPNKPFSSSWLP